MADSTSTESMDKLKSVGQGLFKALGEKAISSAGDRIGGLTDHLEGVADGGPLKKAVAKGGEAAASGDSPIGGALKGAVSGVKDKITGGGGGKGSGSPKATKATNIIETIDVGVPVRVAYNQWTEFGGFPSFMKKVEKVEASDDNKLEWKAQIVWSHRTWSATILEQAPDEKIVWRSQGQKGHVDGAVTFHEIGPNLTRILVVLEYYPQGLFERTGNIWRAQGRRARAELKHFRRHVMTRTILNPDDIEGWRGTIEDGEVVQSHEEALEEEQAQQEESEDQYDDEGSEGDEGDEGEEPEDEYEDAEEEPDEESGEAEDEYEDAEPEDEEYADEEPEDAEESEEPEDEYEEPEEEPDEESEEAEDEYEEPAEDEPEEEPEAEDETEDEYAEEEDAEDEEPPARSRRRRRAS